MVAMATPALAQKVPFIGIESPESAASDLLGLNSTPVTAPSSYSAFGMGLLGGVDQNGVLKPGVSMSIAPYQLILNRPSKNWPGLTSGLEKALWNTAISVATSKGTDNTDKSARVAVGFSTLLYDAATLRPDADFLGCYASIDKVLDPKTFPGNPVDISATTKAAQVCQSCYTGWIWNRSAVSIYGGSTFDSDTGAYNKLKYQTSGGGVTIAYGFDNFQSLSREQLAAPEATWLQKRAQLIFGIKYLNNDPQPDPTKTGSFFFRDSLQVAAQFRLRFTDPPLDKVDAKTPPPVERDWSFQNTKLSTTLAYIWTSPKGKPHSNDIVINVGPEFKISDSSYFDLGFGVKIREKNGDNAGFVLTQFRYNFATGPTF
jgi:hypothetical protein